MPTRIEVNESINELISKTSSSDRITDTEHREANKQMLDYADQQDADLQAQIDAIDPGSGGSGTATTFNGTIKFDKIPARYASVNSSDISGAITVDATG